MALAQNIDGIPAYTTVEEALVWGSQYGISTYHTHAIGSQIIYMAGSTHDEMISAIRSTSSPSSTSGGGGY